MDKGKEILAKSYEDTVKREKKYRTSQLILCILIASISIPLFKIHFILSGVMILIVAVALYVKIRQTSFERVKAWSSILKEIKKENEPES